MLGSPTALANERVESTLSNAAKEYGTGLYVPSGALWGGEDIRKMSDLGTLKVVTYDFMFEFIKHMVSILWK